MRQVLRVAFDLLLEASRRRWFLALFGAITAVLLLLGFSLQLEVVDGVIAGSRLFGELLSTDLVSAHRVMNGVFTVSAYLGFYGGAVFLALACSDFAPELFSPGRIEHLLSLPVARWQLLCGTYLGVLTLAALGTLYGAGGLTVLLGVKTGLWNARLLLGGAVGLTGFSSLYAVMLASTLFVRSAALSGASGLLTLLLGVLASHRETLAAAMNEGVGRRVFTASAQLAASEPVASDMVSRLLVGCVIFSAAALAVAAWRFERKDF